MTPEHMAREQARIAAEAAKRDAEATRVPVPIETGPAWSRQELEAMEVERVRRLAVAALDAEQAALRRLQEG